MLRHRLAVATTIASLAAAAGSVAGAQTPAAPQPLEGDGFATTVQPGWGMRRYDAHAGRNWAITSPGATTTTAAVPTKDGIAVTLWASTITRVEHKVGHKLPRDRAGLCAALMSPPPGARHVRRRTTPRPAKIAGVEGAAMTIQYNYNGRSIVQRDVVVRRGDHVFAAELDVDRKNAEAGLAELRRVIAAWSWR